MCGLDQEIRRFDPVLPVEEAATPPASWYTSPAFLDRERRRVFARHWLYLGRTDQVAGSGAYIADVIAKEPIVVVRGDDGVLRAFHNSCRHHATAVAADSGCVKELVCPYHGWTYGLEGRLLRAPGVGPIRNFSKEGMGLVPLAAATWGPLVFAGPRNMPAAPETLLATLAPVLPPRKLLQLEFLCRRRYTLTCNWKVFVDNYLDGGYHVAPMHPALAAELNLKSYSTELFPWGSMQTVTAAAPGRVGESGAHYAFVYPNLMLNRYGPWLDVNVVRPLANDRTEVLFDYWITREEKARGKDALEQNLTASEQVQQEDMAICAAVQEGLNSRAFQQGRYAARETGALQFHRRLARDLLAKPGDAPAANKITPGERPSS